MQETEICVAETDVPHVVQGQTETDVPHVVQGQTETDVPLVVQSQKDVRLYLTRLCFERLRVDKCFNCVQNLAQSPDDASFNKVLKIFFVITLILAVKHLISYYMDGDGRIMLLEVFAAFVIVSVLVWTKTITKNIGSAPARKEEVKTKCALIQHV